MKKTKYFYAFAAVMLMGSFLLGACKLSDADATPTLSPDEVQTLAHQSQVKEKLVLSRNSGRTPAAKVYRIFVFA